MKYTISCLRPNNVEFMIISPGAISGHYDNLFSSVSLYSWNTLCVMAQDTLAPCTSHCTKCASRETLTRASLFK